MEFKIDSYYNGSDILTEHNGSPDYFRISPSSLANFFTSTRQWYGENLLGEEGFTGSDSTVLGTIVHYFAEMAAKGIKVPDPSAVVSAYLDSQTLTDRPSIEALWKPMSQTLIDGCIVNKVKPAKTEQFIYHKLLPGIYIAGTFDALVPLGDGTFSLRDYKSSATKPSGIPYHYRMQAHAYAYILTNMGYKISQIELQYVTKPTKTLPCRHFAFTEPFTDEDFNKIEGQLKLVSLSVAHWKSHPEHQYLLAQDFRLFKAKPIELLFKKD